MSALNVVCLISGGKDSLFSILHCKKNGHNIVALANLHPPRNGIEDAVEDLDSYMYQTIGHTIIPLYERALGLPLYRQEIHGSAVNQDRCYGPDAEDDETEALIPLLRRVQSEHPEVNAVSTGAILSDYQRTRVESVAIRLGLTPLSYLWQYPNLPPHSQTSLLEHMTAVGQDSRIIKVASGGLDDSFLWQNVANPRTITKLDAATKRFGSAHDGAVLGEGGEYETLAISGPSPLWKAQIMVDESVRNVVAGDAGSASIQISGAQVSPSEAGDGNLDYLHTPMLLEPQFQAIFDGMKHQDANAQASQSNDIDLHEPVAVTRNDGPDLHSPYFLADITGDGSTAAEQMHSTMEKAQKLLGEAGYDARDVVCTSIILGDMADFSAINPVYSAYFRHPNPPARVTVACAGVLPPERQVMVSLTVFKHTEHHPRNGLHVQSRSYWAPANIGPYSQAIAIPCQRQEPTGTASLVYIAGQIPLVPATMELAGSNMGNERESFSLQAVLALQHTIRIGRAMGVKEWAGAIAFITAADSEIGRLRASLAHQAWEAVHQPWGSETDAEPEDTDLWEARFGANRNLGGSDEQSRRTPKPSILHVGHVDELPRNAAIEWVVYGVTAEDGGPREIPQHRHFLGLFGERVVQRR